MKSKLSLFSLALASIFATHADAKPVKFNAGGLGCGTVVSLRESTQKPIPSELADEYGGPRSTGGSVFQVLSQVSGVGFLAAAAGELVADAAVSTVSSSIQDADKKKQAATATYKDVQAVEFRFDDGQVINVPMMVVGGMRYKVGARLNAMVSPQYGGLVLGMNVMFSSIPSVGDSDYNEYCRIDDPEQRNALLEPARNAVVESRIVDPSERRVAAAASTAQ